MVVIEPAADSIEEVIELAAESIFCFIGLNSFAKSAAVIPGCAGLNAWNNCGTHFGSSLDFGLRIFMMDYSNNLSKEPNLSYFQAFLSHSKIVFSLIINVLFWFVHADLHSSKLLKQK